MDKSISPERVKRAVYNRIDFELSEHIWEEIDTAFAICWNEVIGYGNDVYKDTIMDYVVGHLKQKRILLSVDKVEHIVDIILDYIEMTGGFLDEDAVVMPVKSKRDRRIGRDREGESRVPLVEKIRQRNEEAKEIVAKMLQHRMTAEELEEFVRMTHESQENLKRLIELGLEVPEGEKRQRRCMKSREKLE